MAWHGTALSCPCLWSIVSVVHGRYQHYRGTVDRFRKAMFVCDGGLLVVGTVGRQAPQQYFIHTVIVGAVPCQARHTSTVQHFKNWVIQ